MDKQIIGERIKLIMNLKGIKRNYLATKLKISYNTLTKKLNGKIEFSCIQIFELKKILELSDELAVRVFLDEKFDIKNSVFL